MAANPAEPAVVMTGGTDTGGTAPSPAAAAREQTRTPMASATAMDRSGLERLITFADAVVAIAATLLVLPLVTTATDIGGRSVASLLAADRDELLAFVLSFAVICRFWISHHSMYERIVGYNRPLIWLTCLFLLSIVFLPFPTELIGAAGSRDSAALGLYIGTMLVANTAILGQQWILVRSPALQAPDIRGTIGVAAAAIAGIAMSVVLILALTVPAVGVWWLLLLIPSGLFEKHVIRRRRRTQHDRPRPSTAPEG